MASPASGDVQKPAGDLKSVLAAEINSGRAVLVEKQNAARITLSADYLFKDKSSDFSKSGLAALSKIAAYLAANKGRINIGAHTDDKPVWNARYASSTDLSRKQAEAVRDCLRENGVPQSRIVSVTGRGSTMPLVESADNRARAKNRRVEILITGR